MNKQVLTVAYSMSKFSQRDPRLVYLFIFLKLFIWLCSVSIAAWGIWFPEWEETQDTIGEYGVSAMNYQERPWLVLFYKRYQNIYKPELSRVDLCSSEAHAAICI